MRVNALHHGSAFKVMLTKNLDVTRGLVNGARGVVVAFEHGKQGKYQNKITVYLISIS